MMDYFFKITFLISVNNVISNVQHVMDTPHRNVSHVKKMQVLLIMNVFVFMDISIALPHINVNNVKTNVSLAKILHINVMTAMKINL
jgi:hypothetical protein